MHASLCLPSVLLLLRTGSFCRTLPVSAQWVESKPLASQPRSAVMSSGHGEPDHDRPSDVSPTHPIVQGEDPQKKPGATDYRSMDRTEPLLPPLLTKGELMMFGGAVQIAAIGLVLAYGLVALVDWFAGPVDN